MKKWWQEQPLVISALQAPPSKIVTPAFDDYIAVSSYNVEQSQHPFFEEMDMTFYDEKKHGKILDDYLENIIQNGNQISFSLDKLNEYEVIVIEEA